jgi:hypothetical protein
MPIVVVAVSEYEFLEWLLKNIDILTPKLDKPIKVTGPLQPDTESLVDDSGIYWEA